jgi:hypothetical protein
MRPHRKADHITQAIWLYKGNNKGICRVKHDTTASCQRWQVEQVYRYIKSKCRHCLRVNNWTQ